MNRIPEYIAMRCYDVLVAKAGASEGMRDSFIHSFCHDKQPGRNREFRFGGIFGFAGKFWWNNGRFYVNGHSRGDVNTGGCTDADLEREAPQIEEINKLLAEAYAEFESYREREGV